MDFNRFRLPAAVLLIAAAFLGTPAVSSAMPPVERLSLPNELVLLAFPDNSLPIVTVELLVNAGSWRDPPGMDGLANVTAKSLLRGTGKVSYKELNDRLDFLGASLEADCQKDFALIRMRMLKKDLDAGFDLLMELLTGEGFVEDEVHKEIRQIQATIDSYEDQPEELAQRNFDRLLFDGGSYAHPVEGTKESLERLPVEAPLRFFEVYYRPGNAIMALGGDITVDEVKQRVVPRLVNWRNAKPAQQRFKPGFAEQKTVLTVPKKISQANIALGNPALERGNKDYYALSVLSNIFGSGDLSSRLMTEIRVKRGLAYSVDSTLLARKQAGALRVDLQTKNATAGEAIALVVEEMKRLQREPVSEAELNGA